MITLIMPEWFTWLLTLLAIASLINMLLEVYLDYLKKKINKIQDTKSEES